MSSALRSFRTFAHQHDDFPAFHATFLVCTFLSAALFHAGFFALLIGFHMSLDTVKYREYYGFSIPKTCRAVFLESIHDIALLFLSITFAVYLHHTFFLEAMSGLLRSELSIIRALGIILPRVRIVEHFLAIAFGFHTYLLTPADGLRGSLTRLQKFSLLTIVVTSALLALSFVLYQGSLDALLQIYAKEFGLLR